MSIYHQKGISYVNKISINVSNLEGSLAYYENIIGFSVLEREENKAVLTADQVTPLLILNQPSKVLPKPMRTTGLYHFALLLKERFQLANFLGHLLEKRIPYGSADHILTEALYLNDPDGNGIEVYYDKKDEELSGPAETLEMATLPLDQANLLRTRTKAWRNLPKDTIIGHIHLHVDHLEEAKKFYVDTLGFDIIARYPGALFISDGGYHHHIGLNTWNGEDAVAAPKDSVGLNWYNIVLPSIEEYGAIAVRLKKNGYLLVDDGDYLITEDPAGNKIRLIV